MDVVLVGIFCFIGGVFVGMLGILIWAALVAAADDKS